MRQASYLRIVRNKILIDVQGEDVLMQIFTSVVLQRAPARTTDFEADHACAIEVHRRAVARYGTGAPTARALQRVAAAEPACVVGIDQPGATTTRTPDGSNTMHETDV